MTGWYRFREDPPVITQNPGQEYKGRPIYHRVNIVSSLL